MQPVTCAGGYALPIKTGHMEIIGIMATVSDTTSASRLKLVDCEDFKVFDSSKQDSPWVNRRIIFDQKGLANADGVIGVMFPEAIKLRKGLAIDSATTNLVAGTIFVYTK